jgi:hypothetical protein
MVCVKEGLFLNFVFWVKFIILVIKTLSIKFYILNSELRLNTWEILNINL